MRGIPPSRSFEPRDSLDLTIQETLLKINLRFLCQDGLYGLRSLLILHAKYGVPALSVEPNRGRVDVADQVQQTQEKGIGYAFVLNTYNKI